MRGRILAVNWMAAAACLAILVAVPARLAAVAERYQKPPMEILDAPPFPVGKRSYSRTEIDQAK